MANRFVMWQELRAKDVNLSSTLDGASKKSDRFARKTETNFDRMSRSVNRFGSVLKQSIKFGAASLASIGVAMGFTAKRGAEFEQTITNAVTKFNGSIDLSKENFDDLRKTVASSAKEIGKTTEFSASQAAEAINFLAAAGFNAEQTIASLAGVVDLATASQTDLGRATDITSDTLGAFGLMTKDTTQLAKNLTRVNDVLAKTVTSSNVNMEMLFETMKTAAPNAVDLGLSIETLSAMVGTLANAGLKGTTAATGLRAIFTGLTQQTSLLKLDKLGVTTKDASGNLLDIFDILGQIKAKTKDMGTSDRAGLLGDIFSARALPSLNNLLRVGTDNLREYKEQLDDAGGASKKMANIMRDTLTGRFKTLLSTIEGVVLRMFELESGPMSGVIDRMTEWIRLNEDLISQDIGKIFADLASVLENLVKLLIDRDVLGKVSTFLKGLTKSDNSESKTETESLGSFFRTGIFGFNEAEKNAMFASAGLKRPSVTTTNTSTTTTSTAEVTIRAPQGTAEVTQGKLSNNVQLVASGAF